MQELFALCNFLLFLSNFIFFLSLFFNILEKIYFTKNTLFIKEQSVLEKVIPNLHRNGCFYGGICLIPRNRNIRVLDMIKRCEPFTDFNMRQLIRISRTFQLLFCLIEMIHIQMQITKRVNKFADFETTHISDQMRQKRVRCNIIRNAQK